MHGLDGVSAGIHVDLASGLQGKVRGRVCCQESSLGVELVVLWERERVDSRLGEAIACATIDTRMHSQCAISTDPPGLRGPCISHERASSVSTCMSIC